MSNAGGLGHTSARVQASVDFPLTVLELNDWQEFSKDITASSAKDPVSAHSLWMTDNMSLENFGRRGETQMPDVWKPQKKELVIMISLSFISLMVALDATILVTVLPVSHPLAQCRKEFLIYSTGNSTKA